MSPVQVVHGEISYERVQALEAEIRRLDSALEEALREVTRLRALKPRLSAPQFIALRTLREGEQLGVVGTVVAGVPCDSDR